MSQSSVTDRASEGSSGLPGGRDGLRFKGKSLLCDVSQRKRFKSQPVLEVLTVRAFFFVVNAPRVIKGDFPHVLLPGFLCTQNGARFLSRIPL